MNKDVIILGSTGSIGTSTLRIIKKDSNFKVKLLSANKNIKKLLNQAIEFKVKNVIIEDETKYKKYFKLFKNKNINLYIGLKNIENIITKKTDYCINAISGIDGLYPTLKIIPLTKNILIANKESIICGWHLIAKKLKLSKTAFIPIDSEHFSIWKLIKNENKKEIKKIILTASGGPFLNKSAKKTYNINPKLAIRHPNWKMGKKISIDSSNMMNKVLEFIEAKKIFRLKKKKLSILIHPSSYIHAIVLFKGNLVKFLAHDTEMIIPISNALSSNLKYKNISENNIINKFNKINFLSADENKFPLLKIIKFIPEDDSYFETILITLNDTLVNKYLAREINYISIQKNLLNFIKKPYFSKFYKLKPKNIYDIKNIINKTKNYLDNNIKYYEN
tara:strand:+ start:44 stop:1216 length:1173 start_codon:yes stop_codon:yes gene_type:complete